MTWKEEQRALAERAKMCRLHKAEQFQKPGATLIFSNRSAYKRQADGSLKFVGIAPPAQPAAPKPPK